MIDIIAEFGSNPIDYGWNTINFCRAASNAGATHVKIQVYKAEHFPAPYQDEKRRLEFPRNLIRGFSYNARCYGLKAGASVFDEEAINICAAELDFLKLAAREQYNYSLGESVSRSVILCNRHIYRSLSDLTFESWGESIFNYLYCTPLCAIQEYPTAMLKALVRVVQAAMFFKRYGVTWGLSSHTTGALDCILAARLGANVIEKHFALSPSDVEAGHSLLPDAFAAMARGIRRAER
jgi:N-acetylneuraminate synthase